MTLLIIKEVTVDSVTKYRLYYNYWIWIFLILLLFWHQNPVCIDLPVPEFSYTSLGQCINSKTYASCPEGKRFQCLNRHLGTVGPTIWAGL